MYSINIRIKVGADQPFLRCAATHSASEGYRGSGSNVFYKQCTSQCFTYPDTSAINTPRRVDGSVGQKETRSFNRFEVYTRVGTPFNSTTYTSLRSSRLKEIS